MTNQEIYRVNNPQVINETIDGEAVIINLDTGFYYSLDKVGAEIWDLIAQCVPGPKIAKVLASRYQEEQQVILDAVNHLIGELKNENLIVPGGLESAGVFASPDQTSASGAKSPFSKPVLNKFGDMKDLLLLDPIHDVDKKGWPHTNENDPEAR